MLEWRLEAYRRISTIESESDRRDVMDELIDRYGDPPQPVLRLMDVAMLKSLAAQAQVELLQQKSDRLFIFKFVQGADIDPLKLIDLVNSFRNRLIMEAGSSPSLKFYLTEGGFKQVYGQAAALLAKLVLCKREAS